MSTLTRGYLTTTFGQLHYLATVTAEEFQHPKLLVMLHQTASSGAMFEKVMVKLMYYQHSFTHIVAIDTPGFGNSAHVDCEPTMANYAAAIAQAIREYLATQFKSPRIEQCVLYGHHTGAAVALPW